jgi:large subunit ribosomal protein L9
MMTKVLLIDDVEDLGRKGEIYQVRPGFAYNYLLPQKFAIIADKAALKKQARLLEERKQKALEDKNEAEAIAAKLLGETIETIVKIDHEGHMYGSVSSLDIVHLIKLKTGIDLEKRMVQLDHPIKVTGVFPISIRLKEGVEVLVTLKIIPEESL